MRITHYTFLPLLTSVILFLAPSTKADVTYVFDASFNEGNVSGTMVLNTSSSLNGSIGDIVSLTLSDSANPGGDNPLPDIQLDPGYPPFQWTPTTITQMYIEADAGSPELWSITSYSIVRSGSTELALGSWVETSVPDTLSTFLILLISTLALFFGRSIALARCKVCAIPGRAGR